MEEVGETELLAACRAGRVLECGDGGMRRPIDAMLLRRSCKDLTAEVDPRGITLRNAAVTGGLDLAGMDVRFPLRFEGCDFDSPLLVEGAAFRADSGAMCPAAGPAG